MNKKKRISLLLDIVFLCLLIGADQYTKYLAVLKLKNQTPVALIKTIFELQYLENRGAAFGILQNQKMFFVFAAVIILSMISYVLIKVPSGKKYRLVHICLIMIASGAVGNMIDKVMHNYVVDFLYFKLINFPIFNVADICVSIGTVLLIFSILFYYKEEDLNFLKLKIINSKSEQ